MSSLNKVMLIGRIGKDPEIRNGGNNKPIVSFSLATSETWKDKSTGDKKEKTEWHNVVCFNEGLCRIIEHYVKKGDKIYIEGSLQTDKYTDKNGVERYTTKIVLQNFKGELILLNDKRDKPPVIDDSEQYRPLNRNIDNSHVTFDDDIPF